MVSTLVFTASEDEILLQEVQKNDVLYDLRNKDYRNVIIKDAIWKGYIT